MSAFDDIARLRPDKAEEFQAMGILPPPALNPCHRADCLEWFDGWKCYPEAGHHGPCNMVRITETCIESMRGPSGTIEHSTLDD